MKEALSGRIKADYLKHWAKRIEENCAPPQDEAEKRFLDNFFTAAETVVARMNTIKPNPEQGRTGGVMMIAITGDQPYLVAREIGTVNAENPNASRELDRQKIAKYFVYALGKMLSLVQEPNMNYSRSSQLLPLKDQLNIDGATIPGGAIKLFEGILVVAFSGYSEDDDESVILATLVEAGILETLDTTLLAKSLGNYWYLNIAPQLTGRNPVDFRIS